MGGLFQIIIMIGISVVSIFSERIFVSSIIKKIYQIDQTRENIINNLHKQKHAKLNERELAELNNSVIDLDNSK